MVHGGTVQPESGNSWLGLLNVPEHQGTDPEFDYGQDNHNFVHLAGAELCENDGGDTAEDNRHDVAGKRLRSWLRRVEDEWKTCEKAEHTPKEHY